MKNRFKKIYSVVSSIVTGLLVAFAAFMIVFTVISSTTAKNGSFSLFGHEFYIVETNSMDGVFSAGDLISVDVSNAGKSDLQSGQIITFVSSDPDIFGQTVTHMIREPTTYMGKPAYVTYGYSTGADDEYPALASDVIGTYAGKWTDGGYFFAFLRSVPGYICCILLPLLLIIGVNSYYLVTEVIAYRREKGIDRKSLQKAKNDAVEENERLKKEIEELRQQQAQAPAQQPDDKENQTKETE